MRILCIAAAGGHLEQMFQCLDAFAGHEVVLAYYDWDTFRDLDDPRLSRRVGLPYWGDGTLILFLGTVVGAFKWAWLLATYRPQVLFSTGAELAIVPFWLGRLFLRARTVYLETAARKERPSLTGRCLYPVCTTVLVQSPELLKYYGPKARYEGALL